MNDKIPQRLLLTAGQTAAVTVGKETHHLTLRSFHAFPAPWYSGQSANYPLIYDYSEVDLVIDGQPHQLRCGPYELPQRAGDLLIQVDMTPGLEVGLHKYDLNPGEIAVSVQSAANAWMPHGLFAFPIRDFWWGSTNYRNTWLGKVHFKVDPVYYHRGDDFGAYPDSHEVASMCDGIIKQIPPSGGDGQSNAVIVENALGFQVRLAHMNDRFIRKDLQAGDAVQQGEVLGRTGTTWQGREGITDPHLHIDIRRNGILLNTYPIVVQAYQEQYPNELLAVAGPQYMVPVGQGITLKSCYCIPSVGAVITNTVWNTSDNRRVEAPTCEVAYDQPGVYSEQLTVRDSAGHEGTAFAEVICYDPAVERSAPPRCLMMYYPSRAIKPHTEVAFYAWTRGMQDAEIDFGDGVREKCQRRMVHSYAHPGTYTVTVSASNPQPATFRLLVQVTAPNEK